MRPFTCEWCRAPIDPSSAYAIVYDNEQYYPWAEHICVDCKAHIKDAKAAYQRGWQNNRSKASDALRRENKELKNRLRITTDLLEGREPTA